MSVDPADRTREVGSQVGVFSLLGRAIGVLVGGGGISVSRGVWLLASLLRLLVVPAISAPAVVLLALVTLVILVLRRVCLGVNLPLCSRWIWSLCRCRSRLRWIIWGSRLHWRSYLRGLLILLWSGLGVCRRGWLWRIVMGLGLRRRKSWCSLLVVVWLRCDRGEVRGRHIAEALRWTGGSMGMELGGM